MVTYTRRVQLTGGSTYILSLPSRWVKESKITKGSEITIEDAKGKLLISHGQDRKTENIKRINIGGKVNLEHFQRAITSLYISDFDTLIITSSQYMDQTLREAVKRFSRLVMGIEIFEESSRSVVLQNVLDSASFPLSNAIRRMSLNVETMIEDVISGINESDDKLLDSVINRDDEVDRYQLYVYREVKSGKSENENSVFYLIFSRILERMADHAVNICKLWKVREDLNQENKDSFVSFLKTALNMYRKASEAFYARKFDELNGIIERKPELISKKQEILTSIHEPAFSYTISSSSEEVLRIALYATDIAELAMDMILGNQEEFSLSS